MLSPMLEIVTGSGELMNSFAFFAQLMRMSMSFTASASLLPTIVFHESK